MQWSEVTNVDQFKQAVAGGETVFSITRFLNPSLTNIFLRVIEDVEWCSQNESFVSSLLGRIKQDDKAKELGKKVYKTGTVDELVGQGRALSLRHVLGRGLEVEVAAEHVNPETLVVLLKELPEEKAAKLLSKYISSWCPFIPKDVLKRLVPKIEVDLESLYSSEKQKIFEYMSEAQKTLPVRLMMFKEWVLYRRFEEAEKLAETLLSKEALKEIAKDTLMSEFMCTYKKVEEYRDSRDVDLLPFLSPEGIYEVVTSMELSVADKGRYHDWTPLEAAVLAWKEPERIESAGLKLHYSTIAPFVSDIEEVELSERLLMYRRMRQCQLEMPGIQLRQLKDYLSENKLDEADAVLKKMLEKPQEAITLILEDGTLTYYLVEGRENLISKYITEEKKVHFLPFLTPSEVKQVGVDHGNRENTYDGFTGDTVARLEKFSGELFPDGQFMGQTFLRTISPLEMAFVAKHYPEALRPYLPHLEYFHLSVVVPFLPLDQIRDEMIPYATEEQKLALFERVNFNGEIPLEAVRLAASFGTVHIDAKLSDRVDMKPGPYTRTKEPISEKFQRRVARELAKALQKPIRKPQVVVEEYPKEFEDPILGGLYEHPYRLPDGNHLDHQYIQKVGGFEKGSFINPYTQTRVELYDCVLDLKLREKIQDYLLSRNTA